MKSINKVIIITIIVSVFLSSCYVTQPDAYTSNPDYNKRVSVTNARYYNQLSPVGAGTIVAGTATGMYWGYKSNMFTKYDGANQTKIAMVGMILGGFLGYYTSRYINKLFGWQKVTYPNNPQEWIQKSNPEYKLLTESSNQSFALIHPSAENQYKVKELKDAQDFALMFPNSSYSNNVAKQSANIVTREQIPEVIKLYPNSPELLDFKLRYLNLSKNISETVEAGKRYPEIRSQAEEKSLTKINNYDDLMVFRNNYPASKKMNQAIDGVVYSIPTQKIPDLISAFPSGKYGNLPALEKAEKRYIDNNSNSLRAYLAAVDKYPSHYKRADVEEKSARLVSDYNDAVIFKNQFGANSIYKEKVFGNALSNIKREEIPQLIALLPSVSESTFYKAKKIYLEKSNSIAECYQAAKKYSSIFELADKKAYNMAYDYQSFEDYMFFFKSGSYLVSVQNKYRNKLQSDYYNVNKNNEQDLTDFVKRFAYKYDPDSIVYKAQNDLRILTIEMAKKYDRMVNQSSGYRLVQLVFEAPNGRVASQYLDRVANSMMGLQSGWVFKDELITDILDKASKGSRGVVHGEWYRSGTTHGNSWALVSKNEGFPAFQRNIKAAIESYGMELIYCYYLGSYEDDEAKARRNEEFNREWEAKQQAKEAFESSSVCWKDAKLYNADNTECGVELPMYKVTCVNYEGEEETKYYYYWGESYNEIGDCIFNYGQGWYESRFGSDTYLGDEGEQSALQRLCGCGGN